MLKKNQFLSFLSKNISFHYHYHMDNIIYYNIDADYVLLNFHHKKRRNYLNMC